MAVFVPRSFKIAMAALLSPNYLFVQDASHSAANYLSRLFRVLAWRKMSRASDSSTSIRSEFSGSLAADVRKGDSPSSYRCFCDRRCTFNPSS